MQLKIMFDYYSYRYLHHFSPALSQRAAASFAAATGDVAGQNGDDSKQDSSAITGVVAVTTKDRAIDAFIAMHDKVYPFNVSISYLPCSESVALLFLMMMEK